MGKRIFRIVGRLEGLSFLCLLFVAMPLKYYFQWPAGVKLKGSAHGMLFLIYCAVAYFLATEEEWPLSQRCLSFLAAVMPFGTFVFERKYLK
jgi:integral membrane protein